jgi:NNP family nitrate/nitrite transporter-like MFS transporter
VGGQLADTFGGVRLLTWLYIGTGILMLDLSTSPPLAWGTILMILIMGLLGLGNGAVFQLVPQRFPKEIGAVTGIVGATGALGGFLLPTMLGAVRQWTGSFSGGFLAFAAIALSSAYFLVQVSQSWEGQFIAEGGRAKGGLATDAFAPIALVPMESAIAGNGAHSFLPVPEQTTA